MNDAEALQMLRRWQRDAQRLRTDYYQQSNALKEHGKPSSTSNSVQVGAVYIGTDCYGGVSIEPHIAVRADGYEVLLSGHECQYHRDKAPSHRTIAEAVEAVAPKAAEILGKVERNIAQIKRLMAALREPANG